MVVLEECMRMYESGMSIDAVAKVTDISAGDIQRYIRQNSALRVFSIKDPKSVDAIRNMCGDYTPENMAKIMRLDEEDIALICDNNNIKIPPVTSLERLSSPIWCHTKNMSEPAFASFMLGFDYDIPQNEEELAKELYQEDLEYIPLTETVDNLGLYGRIKDIVLNAGNIKKITKGHLRERYVRKEDFMKYLPYFQELNRARFEYDKAVDERRKFSKKYASKITKPTTYKRRYEDMEKEITQKNCRYKSLLYKTRFVVSLKEKVSNGS